MATPNVGILTNAGKNLIDQVNAGQTKITFSKIVFSSMDNSQLTDDQVKALTSITPQEVVVDSPEVTLDNNTGETRIRATGTNEALTDGVYVKTYAVYAKDDSGNEILYGITVSPNPNYLPEYDGVTPQVVTYSYKVNISNTSNITFTNSNDVYASETDLAEALQPYAKTVDVNQQLDKKVNVTDMRKPASDVAGIEEVNAKQDKIAYTPADDSKVVHSTDMRKPASDVVGLEDIKSSVLPSGTDLYTLINTSGQPLSYYVSTYASAQTMVNKPTTKLSAFKLTTASIGDITSSKYNYTFLTLKDQSDGSTYEACLTANVLGAISVARPWYKVADDSTVAHLSGANNFDTVPTVNNNPLLLASSLPSDLARLSHDANFTAKLQQNGQDVALANNTIYRNPDTGSVSMANTFTAAQTFSIAPVINDASTDKGDNQAATMADLKSVENSAWCVMTGSSDFFASFTCLYKINTAKKRIELIAFGETNQQYIGTMVDLSSIISGITSVDGWFNYIDTSGSSVNSEVNFSGTKLTGQTDDYARNEGGGILIHKGWKNDNMDNNPCYVYYTGLV